MKEFVFNRFNDTFLEYCVIEPENNTENVDIVLIHGFGTDGRSWKLLVNANKNFRYHLLNLPGCGHLKYPRKELTVSNIAKSIASYIDSLQKNVVIVGHSLGASLSALSYYFMNNKKLVKKIVLMSPYAIFSIPSVYNKWFLVNIKTEKHFEKLQNEIFNDYRKTLQDINDDTYYDQTMDFYKRNLRYLRILMFNMANPYSFGIISKALKKIDVEFCLMLAENDKFVNYKLARNFFSKNFENFYYILYRGCGHGFFIEEPNAFQKDLVEFIEGFDEE